MRAARTVSVMCSHSPTRHRRQAQNDHSSRGRSSECRVELFGIERRDVPASRRHRQPPNIPIIHINAKDRQFPRKDGAEVFRVRAAARASKIDHDPQFSIEVAFGEGIVVQGQPIVPTLNQFAHFTEASCACFVRNTIATKKGAVTSSMPTRVPALPRQLGPSFVGRGSHPVDGDQGVPCRPVKLLNATITRRSNPVRAAAGREQARAQ